MVRLYRWAFPALVITLGATIELSAGRLRAAEVPAAARWIDAEAVVAFAEVPRPGDLIDRIRNDDVLRIFQAVPGLETAMRDNPQIRELRQVVDYLASVLETSPEGGLRTILGGGVVLAIEHQGGEQRVYLVVTPTDVAFLEAAHAKLLELARRDAEEKGRPDPVKEADYRGVHGYSVDDGEAHAILENTLVIASGGDALKALIDRIRDHGPASPLAEDSTWIARREAAGEGTAAWALVNLARLREIDPATFAPETVDPGAVFVFGPWIEAARKADWASLSLAWTDGRIAADLAIPRPEGDYSPAMSGYLPAEGSGAPAPLVVPGLVASGTLWRDLAAIWEARGDIFPPEAQQGFAQLDTFAGQFFGGRDFGSGVLGAIGTQWRVVVARQDPALLDPVPDLILPAFAIVIDLTPDDPEFAIRLKAAFQSFIGLANLGAAETKAPPLMLGSEDVDGITISTARYLPPQNRPTDEPIPQRHNFSPSAFQVGDHFVISSSLGLARDLVATLKAPSPETTDATLLVEAHGSALAGLVDQNRERLVTRNMLDKGNDRGRAEGEVDLLKALLAYLGHATLQATDTPPEGLRIQLNFDLER